ncbi:MAG: FtsX-like permease family protein, partial [Oscillospiraceae bacterium]
MLFKLSLSNLRKSIQDYAVYFFTLVIGVAVFYVFNSIETQTAFLEISTITKEIITLLLSMLSGVSVFVSVVLGLLIVYASRFMMKRRNREFALYLMLGMGKGKISAIIFIETFIIGLISLAAGLVVGIIASQFMSTFAANLFEANMSQYHFAVSGKAILKTIAYFGIMYIAEMLFNGIIVSKCRLIDLMQSGKKSEKLKLKNPVLCVLIFLASSLALAYAYYRVCFNTAQLYEKDMIIMICIGSVSTFFIFWSVSGMLLRIIMSVKKVYYRGLNSFTFRQLSSKVNTMVMSMTIICLMLFVTICTLSSAFSMRNSLN